MTGQILAVWVPSVHQISMVRNPGFAIDHYADADLLLL